MAEVFSAEVTVSIAKYAAEIAKIEGATSKSATKAAAALVGPLVEAQRKAASEAQKVAAKAVSASEAQASATSRLIDLAAQHGSAEDRLNRSLEKTRAEIWSLAAASGDAEQAQRALVAAETEHAASLARLRNQQGAVTTSVNTTSGSYGNLINQLADIGKGVAGGQSPLTIMTQQGEQVAFALEQAGGATEVLRKSVLAIKTADAGAIFLSIASGIKGVGVALLPIAPSIAVVTAAAAALGYAWHQASKELDAANAAMEASADAAAKAQEAYEDLAEVRTSTTDKWLVATGQATSADLELRDAVASITEVYGPRIKAKEDDIKATEAAIEAALKASQTAGRTAEETKKANDEYWAGKAALEQHKAALAGLTDQQGIYLQRAAIGILTEDDANDGRKKGTKEIRDRINALQEENDLAAKNSKTYHDALNSIDDMSFGLKKNKDDVELLSDAYKANLETIRAKEQEALALVVGNADAEYTARHAALSKSLDAQEAFYRDLEALRKASEEKANKAAEDGAKLRAEVEAKEANARAREYQRQLETFTDVADAIQGIGRNGAAGMFADMSAEIVGATGEARKLKQELLSGDISALEFADSMRELARDTTRSLVNTLGDGLGSVFQARFDDLAALAAEASAVAAGASSDVIKFQESIEASQLAQREAADLTGQALRRAYELGVVGVDDLSDAQRKQIESSLLAEEAAAEKKQKAANKAAKNAWAATQASAASQAAVLTLLSVSQALASVPPPFNIPVAGLALAAGIAQEAAIASAKPPSFRRGGSAMPDERQVVASVEDGELLQVTSRQGAAKARSDANNAGMSATMGGTGTALVLNGRDIGRIIEAGVQSARGRRAVTQAPARGRAPRKGN